jgi:CHAD domain-containing protein
MPLTAERSASFLKRLDVFVRRARHLHEGTVEAVHETRVASRRLREVIPLVGLDPDTSGKLSQRLSKVTRRLGQVREFDVLMLTIDELIRDDRYSSRALMDVGADVAKARAAAREHVATKLTRHKIDKLVTRLRRAAKLVESNDDRSRRPRVRGPKRAWLSVLETRVALRANAVRSTIEIASTSYVPLRLHDVRIALKKLRYAAELLAEARHQRTTPDLDALRSAQDLLGHLHDLEVLLARANGLHASAPPSDFAGSHQLASLISTLEEDCRRLHARYMHDRAQLMAIASRMGTTRLTDALGGGRIAS